MKKLLFIINPKAGKKKKDYTTDILAVFKNAGYATKIVSTQKRADGTLLAKKYGEDSSKKFVNGILASVVKENENM